MRARPGLHGSQIVCRHRFGEWIPPPHLDHGQPRTNGFHHPEKSLTDDADDGF